MSNSTLKITAPTELLEQVVETYAERTGEAEGKSTEEIEALAVDQLLADFREAVVARNDRLQAIADKKARAIQREATSQAIQAARPAIEVTITKDTE